MIDNTDVVTYFSANAPREDLCWTAYVVLPNGEYWGVRFSGATEEIACTKAISFWTSEQQKVNSRPLDKSPCVDPWADVRDSLPDEKFTSGLGRGSHLRGKTWMRHEETRKLIAVSLTEITMYEQRGYIRSGPRGK